MVPNSDLVSILSSRPHLVAFARTALCTPQAQHPSPNSPAGTLAVLLFLLDALVFLRASAPHSRRDGSSSGATGVTSQRGWRGDDGEELDVGARTGASRRDTHEDEEDEDENDWDAWISYIGEVYLYPLPGEAATTWNSPLRIPASAIPSLAPFCASTSYTPVARSLLSDAALSAYSYLSPSSCPLSTLLTIPLPPLLPHSLLANLSSTLASRRRAAAHSKAPSTQTFRSVLTTLLEYFFGSEAFKVVGERYASDDADDRAIKAFFDQPSPIVVEDEEGEVVNGVHKASASIRKRDDKLRWIFGDNFQNQHAPAEPSHSKPIPPFYDHRSHSVEDLLPAPADPPLRARPLSLSSYSSSAHSTPAPHRRQGSTTSSITPLLRPSAPPSIHTPTPLLPTPSHTPFANLAPAPPSPALSEFETTNTLTAEERRDHVWRTRKLQSLLGAPLDEQTVRGSRRSLDVPRPTGRRHSIPPPSPTSQQEFNFARPFAFPIGVGSSISMARSTSSPMPLTPSTESFRPPIPNASSFSALGGTPELVREERRRKLAKVQRLLGEKVPAHLALNDEVGGRTGSVGRKGIGGMLKGALGIGRSGSKGSETKDQWFERAELTKPVEVVEREGSAGARESSSQIAPVGPIKGMAKARKLEQLFGDLPPTSLYLARPQISHQRSISDLSSLHSFSRQARTLSRSSSIDSYRNSIASLKYLIERDPAALDDIAREYARESVGRPSRTEEADSPISPTYDPLELSDSDPEIEVEDPRASMQSSTTSAFAPASRPGSEAISMRGSTVRDSSSSSSGAEQRASRAATLRDPSSPGLGRSSSHGSQFRTVKKAQKLASFFGTTRGQVWGMLLDDLEAAIVEEGINEDERQEVLDCVSRLRESAA